MRARLAQGRLAQGRFAQGRFAEGRFAEGRFAEGRFAEGRFAEVAEGQLRWRASPLCGSEVPGAALAFRRRRASRESALGERRKRAAEG